MILFVWLSILSRPRAYIDKKNIHEAREFKHRNAFNRKGALLSMLASRRRNNGDGGQSDNEKYNISPNC